MVPSTAGAATPSVVALAGVLTPAVVALLTHRFLHPRLAPREFEAMGR